MPRGIAEERRLLTVLFSDLVGSTAIAAELDQEDYLDLLRSFHDCVSEAVSRHGGYVAELHGDGVVAYFGYPSANEEDGERAVRAALAVVSQVRNLGGPVPVHVRLGIDTGVVVVGRNARNDASAIGSTPNRAARLQALAEPDTVVISERTRSLLGDLFDLRDLGDLQLKGFAGPVKAWCVIRESPVQSRFEALHPKATRTPFVGRQDELSGLTTQWQQAQHGQGSAVLVSGEAGIGKSRIVSELQARCADPTEVLRYFALPYHQTTPLYPFSAQLAQASAFVATDGPEVKRTKLVRHLTQTGLATAEIGHLLDLLSLPREMAGEVEDLSPARRREGMFAALLRYITHKSARRSTLIVFEDAHWIDPTSGELLDQLIDMLPELPVFLVVTGRPEFQPSWLGKSCVETQLVDRLSSDDCTLMVQHIAQHRSLIRRHIDDIVRKTDGVPLFVEELTAGIIDTLSEGAPRDGAANDRESVPHTLRQSLAARLDRLSATAKSVVQIGSIFGNAFEYGSMRQVSQLPTRSLDGVLRELVGSGLIFEQGSTQSAGYTFKHALVRDTAYESLHKDYRRQLHKRVADALRSGQPDLVDRQPELLAYHMHETGILDQAARLWNTAGQKAKDRGANREASIFLYKSLNALFATTESPAMKSEALEILLRLHQTLYPLGEFTQTLSCLEKAEKLAEELGATSKLAYVLAGQCYTLATIGKLPAAIEKGLRARVNAPLEEDLGAALEARQMLARSLYAAGRYREAVQYLEEAAGGDDAQPVDRNEMLGTNHTIFGLTWRTLCLAELGEFESGAALGSLAVRLADQPSSSDHDRVWARLGFGRFLVVQQRYSDAVEVLQPALELCNEDWQVYFSRVASSLGSAYVSLGRIEEGLALLREASERNEQINFTFGHSLVLSQLGDAYLASGQQEKAREVAHRAIDLAVRVGEIGNAAWAHCLMAKVMNHEGKTSEMRRHYLSAQLLAGPAGMQPIEALCAAGEHASSSGSRV